MLFTSEGKNLIGITQDCDFDLFLHLMIWTNLGIYYCMTNHPQMRGLKQ